MTTSRSRTNSVHEELLGRLNRGDLRPGSSISVKETAERLNVSPTPVREALERLVGSGAVDQSPDRSGFVVPRLGLGGYVQHVETYCLLAQAAWRSAPETELSANEPTGAEAPAALLRWAFEPAFQCGANPVVIACAQRVSVALSAYHNVEPEVLPDWRARLVALHDALLVRSGGPSAIRSFAQQRRAHAPIIVDVVERR